MMQAEAATVVAQSPNIEVWIARTGVVLVLFLSLVITGILTRVALNYVKVWEREGFRDVSSNLFITVTFMVVLNIFLFGVMDIGQAAMLVIDGWGGIVGISAALLGFPYGYKATTKIGGTKGGTVDMTPTNIKEGGG